jgi:hypothetical protein
MKIDSVHYLVARNYELLPYSKPGNDVDLLVLKEDVDRIFEIINSLLTNCKGYIKVTHFYDYVVKIRIYGVKDGDRDYTELDLITNLTWRGLTWLDIEKVILAAVENTECIMIPINRHELQMTLFHSLLYGGFVKERYKNRIGTLIETSDDNLLRRELEDGFGGELALMVFKKIRYGNWKSLEELKFRLRCALLRRNIQRSGMLAFSSLIRNISIDLKVKFKTRR